MSKRSATSSPAREHRDEKRQKFESSASAQAETFYQQLQVYHASKDNVEHSETQQEQNTTSSPLILSALKMAAPDMLLAVPNSTESGDVRTEKKKQARKAGQGFESWIPEEATDPVPEVQPHWGIVPRTGRTRPSQPQPPARTSNGAIVPPLWEDRKGAVRIKRGARYINNYDQAKHMYLQLMDVRPINQKNQAPRRKAIGYYYPHGMPVDWTDTGALNDVNKALQEAIRAKSKRELPFSATEREIFAEIFANNPNISLWDAAEKFNEQAHPVTGSEAGQYPTGRFIESINHEFNMYKSSYLAGETPTEKTEKDIELEKLYREWKSDETQKKVAWKTSSKKSSSGKMSNTKGIVKKKRISKKSEISPERLAGMEARADATYRDIMEKEAAEKSAKVADDDKVSETVEAPIPMVGHSRPSNEEEDILGVSGPCAPPETHLLSPDSPSTRTVVPSPSYSVSETNSVDVTSKVVQASQVDNEVTTAEAVGELGVVAASSETVGTSVEKAVRSVEIDENYNHEDDDL